jgi:hypothetical protein
LTIMSNYQMTATDLRRIYGQSFQVKLAGSDKAVNFYVHEHEPGTPKGARAGREGYGLRVDCEHPDKGSVPSFLKIFKLDVPERRPRNAFLRSLGLAKRHHWLFAGLPYGDLPRIEINGVRVVGHLAKQILDEDGEQALDLSQLFLARKWTYSEKERRKFCGQLCCAIVTLEGLGLVHGDISPANVMIGRDHLGKEAAILCDFDGFYHESQELLPLKYQRRPVRPAGSPGHQYPQLLEEIQSGSPGACVRTDRFALAAIICQMMVWQDSTSSELGREELLENSAIKRRDIRQVPEQLKATWPEGFDFLRRALSASGIHDMPSPKEWLEILGGIPSFPPRIILTKKNGQEVITSQKVNIVTHSGNFSKVNTELQRVSYKKRRNGVELTFAWDLLVFRRNRQGAIERLGEGPLVATAQFGETVTSGSWSFEVNNNARPSS